MNLKERMKRDGWVWLVCLAAVLVCLLVYNNSLGVLEKCNTYWQDKWEQASKSCLNQPSLPAFYNFNNENNKTDFNSVGGLNQNGFNS